MTAAGIRLSVVVGELRQNDEYGDEKQDDKPCWDAIVVGIFVLCELARAKVHDDIDGVVDARVVVVFLERWNHLPLDDALGRGVGDVFLYAVACVDVHLAPFAAFLGLDEDDRAVVFALLSHAPAMPDFGGVLLDAVALQVIDQENENLGGSAVVVGHELSLQHVNLVRGQGAGVVVHQTRRVGWTRQLGFQRRAQSEQDEKQAE